MSTVSDFKWYIVKVQSGKEFVVKEILEKRIQEDKSDKVFRIEVPTYKETIFRNGKKKKVERKSFPGYVYVQMDYDKEVGAYVKEMPHVLSFVTTNLQSDPRGIPDVEVSRMIGGGDAVEEVDQVAYIDIEIGQKVTIIDGPFNGFSGVVKSISPDKRKVFVEVEIFGRPTPVEIDYYKIKKV